MTITPTEGPGTADPVSKDGLVLPSAFVCRWTELDTAAINSGADSLRSMGNSVRDEVGGMRATWSSLPASYEGPEQELVYTLLDDPRDAAEDLKERFFAAAVQLDTYATILFDIALELMDLDTRAWDFREEAQAGYDERKAQQRSGNSPVHYETEHVSWRENTAAVARNEALVQEYAALLARISSAAVYCANSINELQMGSVETGFTAVTAEQIMNSPEPMPWGSPVEEDRTCEESFWQGAGNFVKNTAVGVTSLGVSTSIRPLPVVRPLNSRGWVWVISSLPPGWRWFLSVISHMCRLCRIARWRSSSRTVTTRRWSGRGRWSAGTGPRRPPVGTDGTLGKRIRSLRAPRRLSVFCRCSFLLVGGLRVVGSSSPGRAGPVAWRRVLVAGSGCVGMSRIWLSLAVIISLAGRRGSSPRTWRRRGAGRMWSRMLISTPRQRRPSTGTGPTPTVVRIPISRVAGMSRACVRPGRTPTPATARRTERVRDRARSPAIRG